MSETFIATKVLPNVWIGDKKASESSKFFSNANIQSVLNMTPTIDNVFRQNDGIEYLRIPVYDSVGKRDVNKMYAYFPVICEFIFKNTVIEKKNILVHCAAGKQRSATAVAAYLVKYYRMTPYEAMQYLLKHKPNVFHYGDSVNFAKSLNKWYEKINRRTEKLSQTATTI